MPISVFYEWETTEYEVVIVFFFINRYGEDEDEKGAKTVKLSECPTQDLRGHEQP
jgi:hypothetical protein